ncbi:hypothetical protein A9G13_10205 [Gilliamella sp. wkB178]|uniref:DUF721 domain-containing protein n=1 Tax=Gilliamella sp. wkB178 TaxID=3120259 RepID=UPI00080E7E5A|nr:DciA family protein [Gilliamella apicola]OCG06627.1 hypothetical protein A9G13_10205 [Gilliamella apicola]
MRLNEPQKLATLLTQDSSLSQIKERTFALYKLAILVNDLLPHALNQQCRVANYRQGILIIEVSSANWLTRLKYEQENIISVLRKRILPSLSSIQYQINPDITVHSLEVVNHLSKKSKSFNFITTESASFLYALAEDAPDKLKKQLIKLANHAK